jgi:hypothetical protein
MNGCDRQVVVCEEQIKGAGRLTGGSGTTEVTRASLRQYVDVSPPCGMLDDMTARHIASDVMTTFTVGIKSNDGGGRRT